MKTNTIYAKDFKCTRSYCDKKAVVFCGGNDPDMTQSPYCREHADEWKEELMMLLCNVVTIEDINKTHDKRYKQYLKEKKVSDKESER